MLSFLLLAGAALACTAALAQGTPAPSSPQAQSGGPPAADSTSRMRLSSAQVQQAFRSIDRDGDGRLSRSELAIFPRVEKHFDRIDADHDGSVSPAEFENALQQAS